MDRRAFLAGLGGALAAASIAQPISSRRPARIGILTTRPVANPNTVALMEGLRERGYVEGGNLVIEYVYSEETSRFPDLAADLVRKQPRRGFWWRALRHYRPRVTRRGRYRS
jgi:putative ABC transport system substrate-binding protein